MYSIEQVMIQVCKTDIT